MTRIASSIGVFLGHTLFLGGNFVILIFAFQPCISIAPFNEPIGRCQEEKTASSRCNSNGSACENEQEANTTFTPLKQLLTGKKVSPLIGWMSSPPYEINHYLQPISYHNDSNLPFFHSKFLISYIGVIKKTE